MKPFLFVLAVGLVGYLGIGLFLYLMQSRLVHLPNIPGRELLTTPAELGLDYREVRFGTADGMTLHGWYLPAPSSRGVLLFCHGNAGNISHRLDSLAIFHDLGLEVLIFDYRGYGLSEGNPEEAGLYRDAQAAMDYLLKERDIDPQRIVVFGRSLGGALAARLAADHPVKGLILESAFTSAADMGAEIYPFYPARLLTRLNYPTRADLQRVRAPVLIIHSRDDEIVSFAHSQRLLEAAPGKSSFLELRGGHNDGFLVSREAYQAGLEGFLADLEDRAP